jgi:hydroxyethylthiazole kinase
MASTQFSAGEWVRRLRAARPLVHNITNLVAMSISANVLLAAGASPVMAHAAEEVEDMVNLAEALVLNIGTLDPSWVSSMRLAAYAAHRRRLPVVLDPVGAGATPYRTRVARALMDQAHPRVIRGNGGEILALAGGDAAVRGVDAGSETAGGDQVRELAYSRRAVVAATGAVDVVSDGTHVVRIANGHPLLAQVTGTGCALSALVAAFVTLVEEDAPEQNLPAAVAALVYFEVAAERAARVARGPGSFQSALLDELATVPEAHVDSAARVTWDA